jgi:beta-glucosidase
LSYTTFVYSELRVSGGETVTASFNVTNSGRREGTDVPQLYLTDAAGDRRMRLEFDGCGFSRSNASEPRESRKITLKPDPRLLARFDGKTGKWTIAEGTYSVAVGKSASDLVLTGNARLPARQFGS